MEMEESDRVNRELGSLHGDVVSPEVLPKKKRPSSLSPNPDYIVQQQMELMTKAAAERAAARAIEKQSEEDRATKRRKADREYHEQREAEREQREVARDNAREDARRAQTAELTTVTSALLAFLTNQTQPRAPP